MSSDRAANAAAPRSSPGRSSQSACQLELGPDLCLDARRAVWFPEQQAIAVADLHLGYAWVKRAAGQLLPLSAPDDAVQRLMALQKHYGAREIILLGDIV